MIKVALLGRPNVGKSTLFNRLAKKNIAIVFDTRGTTRDILSHKIDAGSGASFLLLDMAGLDVHTPDRLSRAMTEQALNAAREADLILFVLDAKEGLTLEDSHLAQEIRRMNKPVIVVINKVEKQRDFEDMQGDLARIGFENKVPVSAEHNLNMDSLLTLIKRVSSGIAVPTIEEPVADNEEEDLSVRIALIGRPNAGKSTLANALIGKNSMLVSDIAGTTRDSVDTLIDYKGRAVNLIDTAGMRRRAKIDDKLEKTSVSHAIEAVKRCDVCMVVIDAFAELDKQDLQIAAYAAKEGKGLLFVANKMDLVSGRKERLEELAYKLSYSFAQVKNATLVGISAEKQKGIPDLMKAAFELYDARKTRISTGKLNRWLETAIAKNPPPLSRLKRPMSIKYISQIAAKPPTFALFTGSSAAKELPASYIKYLANSISKEFGFDKVPVRIKIKSSANPYKDKK
ncbi:MAG: ribosome biogenesis GTPase Der [Alphaproteobacteria bacterium]|nr:ribosome biogenesis GTPase Der [Alphaproteobacteria bacterium]